MKKVSSFTNFLRSETVKKMSNSNDENSSTRNIVTPPRPPLADSPSPRRRRYFADTLPNEGRIQLGESGARSQFFSKSAPSTPRDRRPYKSHSEVMFNLHSPRNTSSRRSQAFSTTSGSFLLPSNTQEMKDLKRKAILKLPLTEIEDQEGFEELLFNLQYERKKLVAQKAFVECDNLNKAIEYVKRCQQQWLKDNQQQLEQEEKEMRSQQFKNELEEFDLDTKAQLSCLEEELKLERYELLDQHQEEIARHEELWNTTKTNEFMHPSSELLNTQTKLNHLQLQCRFAEADDMQKVFNEVKAKDEQNRNEQRQEAFNDSLKTLLKKQQDSLKLFDQLAEVKKETLLMKRKKEREAIEKRNMKLTAPKVRASGNLSLSTRQRSLSPGPYVPSTTITKRDLQKEQPVLNLPQLDTKQVSKDRTKRKLKF